MVDCSPEAHTDEASPLTGVLLVNLGTPDAPTPKAVRRYLAEFLSDRRVVDYPRALWLPLLYGVILNVRPAKTARAYRLVWREETDESPLRYFTRRQAEGLADALGDAMPVAWAMRYGAPSIAEGLAALRDASVERLVVIPLYPQYSTTTTLSVEDALAAALDRIDWRPPLRFVASFETDPLYIEALAAGARAGLAALGARPERVILSYHGLPERLVEKGDPYRRQCEATSVALRAVMGWTEEFAPHCYQSKFGPEKWLGPATDATIEALAASGVKRLAVMTPGFVADCIETLEEIGVAGRDTFLAAGGEAFAALACINDSVPAIALLETIARREEAAFQAD